MPSLCLSLDVRCQSCVEGFDADAAAGIAAVEDAGGTLTGVQKTACNAFVIGLKSEELWNGIALLYLMVGGTSAAHAVNWRNPAAFNVTWVNSPTHSSIGVVGAATAHGGTGFIPSDNGVAQRPHGHFAYYRHSAATQVSCFGGAHIVGGRMSLTRSAFAAKPTCGYDDNSLTAVTAQTNGFSSSQRYDDGVGDADIKLYFNGVCTDNTTNASSGSVPNVELTLLGLNSSGAMGSRTAQLTLSTYGFFKERWSDAQHANLYTLIQALQTALGRQV